MQIYCIDYWGALRDQSVHFGLYQPEKVKLGQKNSTLFRRQHYSELHVEFRKILAGAIVYVLQYKAALTRALALPFIAYLVIDTISLQNPNGPASFLVAIVSVAVHCCDYHPQGGVAWAGICP